MGQVQWVRESYEILEPRFSPEDNHTMSPSYPWPHDSDRAWVESPLAQGPV